MHCAGAYFNFQAAKDLRVIFKAVNPHSSFNDTVAVPALYFRVNFESTAEADIGHASQGRQVHPEEVAEATST